MSHLVFAVLMFAGAPRAYADSFDVSPPDAASLEALLNKLDAHHQTPAWCTQQCVTFLEMRFVGSMPKGEFAFELTGVTTSAYPAFAPLFGASVSLGIDSVMLSGRATPLFWANDTYSAVLPAGEFTLKGSGRFKGNTPVTLHIPGPVGLVSFAVSGADIVGSEHRRGVQDVTYTLSPVTKGDAEERVHGQERLRLQIERDFVLGRERAFTVHVAASGAKLGQVIILPVLSDEIIQTLPASAHVRTSGESRTIEWVADDTSPSLHYAGKWKGQSISLRARDGALDEVWAVTCDDPYQCNFKGNAEPRVGTTQHVWNPLAGQTLDVELQELESHAGINTLAQTVSLGTKATGRSLLQTMEVTWNASVGDLVSLALPAGANVSAMRLNGQVVPVLKNGAGDVQVSIPGGASALHAEWELPKPSAMGFLRIPAPRLSAPVGGLFYTYESDDAHLVVQAGGMAGSPRIDLWPNLVVVLITALALAYGCRAARSPLASSLLWMAAAFGFAIYQPASIAPLVLSLVMSRWLSRATRPRRSFALWFEAGLWALLTLSALVSAAATLQHALFSSEPFSITSFVSDAKLGWGTYIAGAIAPMGELPAPWTLTIPMALERWLWAAWAVAFVVFTLRESRNSFAQMGTYWAAATKPAPKA